MKNVLMIDYSGVMVEDLTPQIFELAHIIIEKHLGVSFTGEEIRAKLGQSSKGGIRKSLAIILSEFDGEKIEGCIKEIYAGLGTLEIKTLPKVRETLRHCSDQGFVLMVSSDAPAWLIAEWEEREGVFFDGIFGEEHGGKDEHIKEVRQFCQYCQIFFVSDSSEEMRFGDVAIGVAAKGDEIRYFDAGAVTVIHSFSEITEKDIRAI